MEDVEKHLVLYENALRLGSRFNGKTQNETQMSQSYNEIMGRSSDVRKKLTWETPNVSARIILYR